jgi:hypothetical protein
LLKRLGVLLAFCHETILRRAGKRLAVLTNGFAFTSIGTAPFRTRLGKSDSHVPKATDALQQTASLFDQFVGVGEQ